MSSVYIHFVCMRVLWFVCFSGVRQARRGMRSCWRVSVTARVTSSQELWGRSVEVTLPTSTLSPSSSSAPSWSVWRKIEIMHKCVLVYSLRVGTLVNFVKFRLLELILIIFVSVIKKYPEFLKKKRVDWFKLIYACMNQKLSYILLWEDPVYSS